MADDQAVNVDLEALADSLTFDDMELLEELAGVAFGDFPLVGGDAPLTTKMLKALAFIALRRTNPDLTLAALGGMRLAQFGEKSPLANGNKSGAKPNVAELPNQGKSVSAGSS
jgi:hypothetical protein